MARPRTNIEPRLVHAARARFLAEGVDGASLRTIARDAKTNIGMVFYYFPTKDDLFLAVVEQVYGKLLVDLEKALAPPGTVHQRVERAFGRLGQLSDAELQVVQLVIRESLGSTARFRKVLARTKRGHLPMLLRTLMEGIERGEIDATLPVSVVLASTMAMGGVPQLLARVLKGRKAGWAFPAPQPLARLSASLLFRAIGQKKTR